MDEDRVARLLEEIRDLQRQQVEAYARALTNQQEALRLQREGMSRARKLLGVVGVITAARGGMASGLRPDCAGPRPS